MALTKEINGLQFVHPIKRTILTKSEKSLFESIRDCVENKTPLTWDIVVTLYSKTVRDKYRNDFWDYNEKRYYYEILDVIDEYKKDSTVWKYKIKGLVRGWFLGNVGRLVIKNKLIVIPVIDLN